MLILQILILLFFMVVIPVSLGAGLASFVERQERNLFFIWVTGVVAMLALFQIVAVPVILLQERVTFQPLGAFTLLTWVFGTLAVLAGTFGAFLWIKGIRKKKGFAVVRTPMTKQEYLVFAVFGLLLLLQLIMAGLLFFGDGDDAFYVAVATLAESGDNMYINLPYTGGTMGLDARHALAPFPIFVAFLARITGLHTATMAHVVMPLFVIPMTYCVYGLIGNRLFKGKKLLLGFFMIFVEVLVLWGNHSPYTVETFLMIRSWQGKAVLANVIIPAAFLVIYLIGERLAEKRKVEKSLWLILFLLVESAALCSTQGCILLVALLGCFGICTMLVYKVFWTLLPLALCLLPAVVYMGMYLWLR